MVGSGRGTAYCRALFMFWHWRSLFLIARCCIALHSPTLPWLTAGALRCCPAALQDDAEQLAANFLELQRRMQPLIQQAGGYGRPLFA